MPQTPRRQSRHKRRLYTTPFTLFVPLSTIRLNHIDEFEPHQILLHWLNSSTTSDLRRIRENPAIQ